MTNEIIFEGFWDTVITKAKQGVLAAAGAVGSSTAKGKLTASLLSDSMFSQWKEWAASTGSELNSDNFSQFLTKMGFGNDFVNRETTELTKLIGDDPENSSTPANQSNNSQKSSNTTPSGNTSQKASPETDKNQSDSPDDEKTATNNAKAQQQKAMQQRMRDKKASGPRAAQTRESLEEAVISDSEFRKFFDQIAQRALKNGEAKSAAQKSVDITRTSAQPSGNPAPAQANGQSGQPANKQGSVNPSSAKKPFPTPGTVANSKPGAPKPPPPKPGASKPAPTNAGTAKPNPPPPQQAAPPPGPAPTSSGPVFTDKEKELMNAFNPDTNLGAQVRAADPEVQSLAQKIMQNAFTAYKQSTGATGKAKPGNQSRQTSQGGQPQQQAQQPGQTPPPPPPTMHDINAPTPGNKPAAPAAPVSPPSKV